MITQNEKENIKNEILAEAISFVSIVGVDVKYPNNNNIMIYIKTDNLKTVELNKLREMVKRKSNEKMDVAVMIPDQKFIHATPVENKDMVCVFIEFC